MDFNSGFQQNSIESDPSHLSLFDFGQDISLYDCLNTQSLPLSAPLPLSLTLQDNSSGNLSIHNLDPSQMVSDTASFSFYSHPDRRRSHPSHNTPQRSLNHYSIPTSEPELSLAIDQPYPSSATSSSYPPNLIDLQSTLQNQLPVLDSIKPLPSSSQADQFDPNDIEPPSTTHDSHLLDPHSNSLQAHLFNSQDQSDKQILLDQSFSIVPINPFEDITSVSASERPKGTMLKYNRPPTTTLSQDFRRRKDWTRRLVEDIEDVILVITSKGEFLFLSQSMSRLTGFPTSELLSSKLFDWCFEEEDSVNLKRELKNCSQHGNQLNLFCRFKKKNSDGFIILEMSGHMIEIEATEKETENRPAFYITGRLYPTSCGRLMDNFLELTIENEMMMRKLTCHEEGWKEWSDGEEGEEEEPNEGVRKRNNKRSAPQKVDLIVDQDEESEEEQDQNVECLSHQIIGRDHPSKPRKRPKRDKVDFLCLDCGVTQSPEWRKGPLGRKTLCNACGLRYAKKGQLVNNNTLATKK